MRPCSRPPPHPSPDPRRPAPDRRRAGPPGPLPPQVRPALRHPDRHRAALDRGGQASPRRRPRMDQGRTGGHHPDHRLGLRRQRVLCRPDHQDEDLRRRRRRPDHRGELRQLDPGPPLRQHGQRRRPHLRGQYRASPARDTGHPLPPSPPSPSLRNRPQGPRGANSGPRGATLEPLCIPSESSHEDWENIPLEHGIVDASPDPKHLRGREEHPGRSRPESWPVRRFSPRGMTKPTSIESIR